MPGVSTIIISKLADHNRFPDRVDYMNDQSRSQFFSDYQGVLLSLEAINEHYLADNRRGWVLEDNIFDITSPRYMPNDHDVLLDCHTHYVSTAVTNWHNAMYGRAKFAFPGVEPALTRSRPARMTEREYLRHLFLDSWNDHVVLTHVPHRVGPNQIPGMPSVDQMVAFRDRINAVSSGIKRILVTGNIFCCVPAAGKNRVNYPFSDPEADVDAYKIYPPEIGGTDPNWLRNNHERVYEGLDMILALHRGRGKERKPVVMIHRHDEDSVIQDFTDPNRDMDPLFLVELANEYKDINFIVFHACYDGFTGINDNNQDLSNPADFAEFWNTSHLVNAMKECDNLYAETGQVLHHMLAVNPGLAQKFINYLLADEEVAKRCVWGTDSPWCGPSFWQTIAFERLNVAHEDRKLAMLYRNGPGLFGLDIKPDDTDWIGRTRDAYKKEETWAGKEVIAADFWHAYQALANPDSGT